MDEALAERIGELFEEALGLSPAKRHRFFADLSLDDADLAAELESLLASHLEAPQCLEALAGRLLPEVLGDLAQAFTEGESPPGAVGRYHILERLDGGGMGVVYQARDQALDRLIALKFLPAHLSADAEAQARLKVEARAASSLDHPNIATIYEIGVTEPTPDDPGGGRPFIAMAYYAGETIKEKIGRGPLPVSEALAYAVQAASGLARAHEAGIVHRDIKPANLIVTDRGQVKILDFGLAKLAGGDLTREGTTLGTVAYMSPEQTRAGPVDHRTDIWSLGVVMYEMLAGERPFRGERDQVLIHAIRHDEPLSLEQARPEVPAALASIMNACLAKDPDDRYQGSEELLEELQAVEAGDAATRARRQPRPRLSGAVASRRSLWSGLALAVAAAAGLTAWIGVSAGAPGGSASGVADADPRSILVLPFAPLTRDTALERLGLALVVTVSANLDGIGNLRAVDALAAAPDDLRAGAVSLTDGTALARRLGAGRLLQGTLIRVEDGVRVEAALYGLDAAAPLARLSVTEGLKNLGALTDSVTIALLHQLWKEAPPAVPSVAAITTSSVPAVRAYLEGERALLGGDFKGATERFERAFEADSAFWFAYWRSVYPRHASNGSAPDSSVFARILTHRRDLPEPDRVLIENWTVTSPGERLARLRRLTNQFSYYWPGWWDYADLLFHEGPYLGTTYKDTRAALERLVALNPSFAPGWDHLVAVAVAQGDTAAAMRAVGELESTSNDSSERDWRRTLRLRAAVLRSGLPDRDSLERVADFVLSAPPGMARLLASVFVADDAPRVQIGLNRVLLARQPTGHLALALRRGEALAWAARGAWDSALVAADRWARISGEPEATLGAYALAVARVALGAGPVAEAERRRPVRTSTIAAWSAEDRAARAWLDGMLAYLQGDRRRIARAADGIAGDSAAYASVLRRSLGALAADAAGERGRAVRELLNLEREIAEQMGGSPLGMRYPFVGSLNRMTAARWLRSLGRDPEAARLLTWHEAQPASEHLRAWNHTIGAPSHLDRGEIAEALGEADQARMYYGRFLRLYDMPVPELRPRVNRAKAALTRLAE